MEEQKQIDPILRVLRNPIATYVLGILAGGLLLGGTFGRELGREEGRRDLESAVKTAKIMDVNRDGRPDLYIGNKIYLATDSGFIPLEQHQKDTNQAEIDAAYKSVK